MSPSASDTAAPRSSVLNKEYLKSLMPAVGKISEQDLLNTPLLVFQLLCILIVEVGRLYKCVGELNARLRQNSTNSNKSPSSDPPGQGKKKTKKTANEKKERKKRQGHQQKLMEPTEKRDIQPDKCTCGCTRFEELRPYYTHQVIELPPIAMRVIHFVLYRGRCAECGKVGKGYVPPEHSSGFGPRLCALIAELGGIDGNSRETVQTFCSSVLKFHISRGAIQKVIDRASAAIKPHYEAIQEKARSQKINHIDETCWKHSGALHWLWVMASPVVAFFMVLPQRSREAFEALIGSWEGILVSDGYAVYQKWVNQRQTCLAHLIRRARGLSERENPSDARCGEWGMKELQRLCKMGKDPPAAGEFRTCFARICRLIDLYGEADSEAGKFARHLEKEFASLFTFLLEEGVEPTNNTAERMLRFGVLWRKRSQGTKAKKGARWVERILSLRHTCRLQGKSTYDVLVDALTSYFEDTPPDLEWIKQAGEPTP